MNKSTISSNERRCLSPPWPSEREAGELRALGRVQKQRWKPLREQQTTIWLWSGVGVLSFLDFITCQSLNARGLMT